MSALNTTLLWNLLMDLTKDLEVLDIFILDFPPNWTITSCRHFSSLDVFTFSRLSESEEKVLRSCWRFYTSFWCLMDPHDYPGWNFKGLFRYFRSQYYCLKVFYRVFKKKLTFDALPGQMQVHFSPVCPSVDSIRDYIF